MRATVRFETEQLAPLDARSVTLTDRVQAPPVWSVTALAPDGLASVGDLVGAPCLATWTLPGPVVRRIDGVIRRVEVLDSCHRPRAVGLGVPARLDEVRLEIVPWFWCGARRTQFRLHQRASEVEIARTILEGYAEKVALHLVDFHPKRELRVQYGETDLDFAARMLEQAGVTMFHRDDGLILRDDPGNHPVTHALKWVDSPVAGTIHATGLELERRVRPGAVNVRDHDLRVPSRVDLSRRARGGTDLEQSFERAHYLPGAFLIEVEPPGDAPHADDRGAFRTREAEGEALALRRLDGKRSDALALSFQATELSLRTGDVVTFVDHPDAAVAAQPWLVIAADVAAPYDFDAIVRCRAVPARRRYRPALVTPRPTVAGVQHATVVGPAGEEIHTDEHGRVRVRFPWDREHGFDEQASPWIHVNQPWAGKGYGGVNIPRVGQEVMVGFLGGDPDRPYIVGRVYTATQPVPYRLPSGKTQSGWRSSSTGGSGGYNQVQFEDSRNGELLRIRAQRDRSTTVLRNEVLRVQGDRAIDVGGFENLSVAGRKYVRTAGSRNIEVAKDVTYSTTKEWAYDTRGSWDIEAQSITWQSPQIHWKGGPAILLSPKIELECGSSWIKIEGGEIEVESPIVEINVVDPADLVPPPNHPALEATEVPVAEGGRGGGRGGGGAGKRRARRVRVTRDSRDQPRVFVARGEVPTRVQPGDARPFDEPDGKPDFRGELSQPATEPFVPPVVAQSSVGQTSFATVPANSVLRGWSADVSSAASLADLGSWARLTPAELASRAGVPVESLNEMLSSIGTVAERLGLQVPPTASPAEILQRVAEHVAREASSGPAPSSSSSLSGELALALELLGRGGR